MIVAAFRKLPLFQFEREGDVLRALPEEGAAELGQLLVALDHRREVVARELPRLGGEVDVAVGEQDLRLGDAARVEHDLARVRVARRVLRAEAEIEVAERDPARLAAPAHVDDARVQRQQPPEGGDRLRGGLFLEARAEGEAAGGDGEHGAEPIRGASGRPRSARATASAGASTSDASAMPSSPSDTPAGCSTPRSPSTNASASPSNTAHSRSRSSRSSGSGTRTPRACSAASNASVGGSPRIPTNAAIGPGPRESAWPASASRRALARPRCARRGGPA